eukprot:g2278.t1
MDCLLPLDQISPTAWAALLASDTTLDLSSEILPSDVILPTLATLEKTEGILRKCSNQDEQHAALTEKEIDLDSARGINRLQALLCILAECIAPRAFDMWNHIAAEDDSGVQSTSTSASSGSNKKRRHVFAVAGAATRCYFSLFQLPEAQSQLTSLNRAAMLRQVFTNLARFGMHVHSTTAVREILTFLGSNCGGPRGRGRGTTPTPTTATQVVLEGEEGQEHGGGPQEDFGANAKSNPNAVSRVLFNGTLEKMRYPIDVLTSLLHAPFNPKAGVLAGIDEITDFLKNESNTSQEGDHLSATMNEQIGGSSSSSSTTNRRNIKSKNLTTPPHHHFPYYKHPKFVSDVFDVLEHFILAGRSEKLRGFIASHVFKGILNVLVMRGESETSHPVPQTLANDLHQVARQRCVEFVQRVCCEAAPFLSDPKRGQIEVCMDEDEEPKSSDEDGCEDEVEVVLEEENTAAADDPLAAVEPDRLLEKSSDFRVGLIASILELLTKSRNSYLLESLLQFLDELLYCEVAAKRIMATDRNAGPTITQLLSAILTSLNGGAEAAAVFKDDDEDGLVRGGGIKGGNASAKKEGPFAPGRYLASSQQMLGEQAQVDESPSEVVGDDVVGEVVAPASPCANASVSFCSSRGNNYPASPSPSSSTDSNNFSGDELEASPPEAKRRRVLSEDFYQDSEERRLFVKSPSCVGSDWDEQDQPDTWEFLQIAGKLFRDRLQDPKSSVRETALKAIHGLLPYLLKLYGSTTRRAETGTSQRTTVVVQDFECADGYVEGVCYGIEDQHAAAEESGAASGCATFFEDHEAARAFVSEKSVRRKLFLFEVPPDAEDAVRKGPEPTGKASASAKNGLLQKHENQKAFLAAALLRKMK